MPAGLLLLPPSVFHPCALSRSPPRGVTLNILRALRSDRWDVDTLGVIKAAVAATAQPAAVRGRTRFHELPDAGHWVHFCSAVVMLHSLSSCSVLCDKWQKNTYLLQLAEPASCFTCCSLQVHTDNPKGLVQLMLPSLVDAARI